MKLPLLVHAPLKDGLKNHTHIIPGSWRIELDGIRYSTFKFVLISANYPEGFEIDMNEPEFYVSCPTRVVCSLIYKDPKDDLVSIFLRRTGDGVQYHTNAQRIKGAFGEC